MALVEETSIIFEEQPSLAMEESPEKVRATEESGDIESLINRLNHASVEDADATITLKNRPVAQTSAATLANIPEEDDEAEEIERTEFEADRAMIEENGDEESIDVPAEINSDTLNQFINKITLQIMHLDQHCEEHNLDPESVSVIRNRLFDHLNELILLKVNEIFI